METKDIGKKIKTLRTRAGIGLRGLSRLAGISPASLITIEKGETSPMLATLQKILKALGVSFSDFFSTVAPGHQTPVYLLKNMESIEDEYRQYTFMLPKQTGIRFGMVYETIAPSGEEEVEWESHNFDLGGVVISGGPAKLEIEEQGSWTVKKGDAYYVKAFSKHRLINTGKRPLKQITVIEPPVY